MSGTTSEDKIRCADIYMKLVLQLIGGRLEVDSAASLQLQF
jgi:hypothetical protein